MHVVPATSKIIAIININQLDIVFSPLLKLPTEAPDTETKYQAAEQAEAKQGVP